MSSASTPPGPNATSGPNTGVLDDAGEQLGAPGDHGLDDDRRTDPRCCLRHGLLVGQPERDASGLGLVRSRRRRLDDRGQPELARGVHRFVDPGGDALGTSGSPYATRSSGSPPGRARRRPNGRGRGRRSRSRGDGRSRRGAGQRRRAAEARMRAPRRARARERPTRDRRTQRRATSRGGHPARLPRSSPPRGPACPSRRRGPPARPLRPPRPPSPRRRARRARRRRRRVRRGAGVGAPRRRSAVAPPSMSTGLATLASAGSTSRRAATVASSSARSSRPAASHASAQRIPSPPAFVTIPTKRPAGCGLREECGDVHELLERRGADHTCLVEEGVDGGVRSRQRSGVRGSRRAARSWRCRSSERAPACVGRPAGRFARTAAGCRRTPRRGGLQPSPRRRPTTRAGRSWRRPPCCRSRRTPRGRALVTAASSSARPRRRSARRSRCSPAAPSATRTSR